MTSNLVQEANLIDLLCSNGLHNEAIDACNSLIENLEAIRERAVENSEKEWEIDMLTNSTNYYKYDSETEND